MRDFLVRGLLPAAMVLLGAVGAGTATHSSADVNPPLAPTHMSPECLRLAGEIWNLMGTCSPADITDARVDLGTATTTGTPVTAAIAWDAIKPRPPNDCEFWFTYCGTAASLIDFAAPGPVSLYVNWGDGSGPVRIPLVFDRVGSFSVNTPTSAQVTTAILNMMRHTYVTEGTYTVTMIVRLWLKNYCASICDYEQAGAPPYYIDQSTQITIKIGPPMPDVKFTIAPPATAKVGQPLSVALLTTNPQVIAFYNVYIRWGDSPLTLLTPYGTTGNQTWHLPNTPAMGHAYTTPGTYEISAEVRACVAVAFDQPCDETQVPQQVKRIAQSIKVVPSPIYVKVDANKTYGASAFTLTRTDTVPPGGATLSGTLSCPDILLDTTPFSLAADPTLPARLYTIAYLLNCTGLTSSDPVNYPIAFVPGILRVWEKALTVTSKDRTKTYGETLASAVTDFTIDGLVNGDTVTGITHTTTGADATAGVAAYDIYPGAITGSGLANYLILRYKGTLTVKPKPLEIKAKDRTKTYGEIAFLGGSLGTEYTLTGMVNSDYVTNVTLASAGAGGTAAVGPYPLVISNALGSGLGNYTIGYVNGTLNVQPKGLTITANNRTKTYGETVTFTGTEFTPAGLVNSDTVTSVALASAGAAATAAVANYDIVPGNAAGTGLGNYTIGYANGTLNVQPATLTLTANNRTKTYGETVTFAGTEFTPAGLANSDSVTSVTLASTGVAATAAVGPHPIVIGNAAGTGLGNYTIGYVNGTLNVQPATLTITANSRTKTYGETVTFAGTEFTPAGLINNDTVTGVSLASAGAAATAPVASYDIVPGNAVGTGLGNYTIGYVNGTLGVQPKALTITANNRVKTYGDTVVFAGTEFTPAGLVNNDAVTSVALASAGADAAAWVGNYDIVPSLATGSGLGNYAIGYANGTLSVQPKTGLAGSTATGTGAASASFTGGGPTCTFDPLGTAFVAPTIEYAGSAQAPHGMFKFRLIGCTVGGTIRMSVTWPSMVGLQYMKYGPSAKVGGKRVFYIPDNLSVSGNTASFDVTDGALGDNDFEANGVIIDPTGPVVPPIEVPTLNAWMLALLGLLLAAAAAMGSRRFRRT